MTVWRVHFHRDGDESDGFRFYRTYKEARAAVAEDPASAPIDKIDVEVSAVGILRALNRHASHPDNG